MINTVMRRAQLARACSYAAACAFTATFAIGTTIAHASVAGDTSVKAPIASQLAPKPAKPAKPVRAARPDPVAMIYAASKKSLLWSAYGQPRELAYEALEALQRAPEHGLDPERYATETLYELIQDAQTKEQLHEFDQLLTAAIWSYNEDLRIGAAHERLRSRHRGHVKRNARMKNDNKPAVDKTAVKALSAAVLSGDLRAHLDSLTPTFEGYRELQSVLDTYNDYHLLGGWEPLPADLRLTPGDEHPAIGSLRYRLILTDGLPAEAATSDIYDEQVQKAVVHFQERHGLAGDGEIGPATLKALNETSADKIRRISLNLARLRQLPKELPKDHIAVNIPEFKLRMFRDAKEALTMGVVVGTRRTPTPAMQDKMRHLVFNPYWYPPHNITVKEILPKLRRDPDYLQRSGFELMRGKTIVDGSSVKWKDVPARNFPYRVRQVPGEKNALGTVKFIFPNKQAIYLHDTPSRKLFGERVRAFSHGCVRLEKPQELATALMDWDRGWTQEEVIADITAAKRKLRKFKETIAIYLVYQTATIAEGVVHFHQDIYGHDRPNSNDPRRAPLVAAALPATDGIAGSIKQRVAAR